MRRQTFGGFPVLSDRNGYIPDVLSKVEIDVGGTRIYVTEFANGHVYFRRCGVAFMDAEAVWSGFLERMLYHPPWTWFRSRQWMCRRAAIKAARQKQVEMVME